MNRPWKTTEESHRKIYEETMLKRYVMVATAATLAVGLSACGSTDPLRSQNAQSPGGAANSDNFTSQLSGTLTCAGASSQESAMDAWRAGFQAMHPDTTITYDPVGSSGGRTQFLEGGLAFAGTDSPLSGEELERATDRCSGAGVLQAPLYISPIAVIYNLDGVSELNLSPQNLAAIFNAEITRWNDPALVADNPDVELPDMRITPVNRSDGSGTTENFTDYLAATAPDAWPHEASDTWPISGSQSAQGTSGVVQTVQGGQGTIGYADASKAGDLGIASIQVGNEFITYSAEAAAAVVDASPRQTGRAEHDIVIDLDRTTTAPGTYPLVLISYSIACLKYEDAQEGKLTQEFLRYLASEEGQAQAAQAAGSAPISAQLRTEINAGLEAIELP